MYKFIFVILLSVIYIVPSYAQITIGTEDTSYSTIDLANPVNWNNSLTKGLIYWQLSLPDRLAGVTVIDLVSQRRGTRTNISSPSTSTSGPSTTNRVGGVAEERFDGTDDYIAIGSAFDFNFERTDTFSVFAAIWIATGAPVSQYIVGKQLAANPFTGWGFCVFDRAGLTSTALTFSMYGTDVTTLNTLEARSPVSSISAGYWYIVGATYDGSSLATGVHLFINGVSQTVTSTGLGTLSTSTQSVALPAIGIRNPASPVGPLNGRVDDVLIYKRQMSVAEVLMVSDDMRTGHPLMLNRLTLLAKVPTATPSTVPVQFFRWFSDKLPANDPEYLRKASGD